MARGLAHPPRGVSPSDWERVRAARAEDTAATTEDLRRLGPQVAAGQMLLVLDEVLTPTAGPGAFHELRTACLVTPDGRRYLSGIGSAFLRQVRAAVHACVDQSLTVVADGAAWIRTFFRDHLAMLPQTELLLDWYHLARKCRDLGARICPDRGLRFRVLRRLLRALWVGTVPRALRVLATQRRGSTTLPPVDELSAYLRARAPWIVDYRTRRRERRSIGNGLAEKANDRIMARRQKRRGMQWGLHTSDGLAALRTLALNKGWDHYWQGRDLLRLAVA